jgi:hypothetical protein
MGFGVRVGVRVGVGMGVTVAVGVSVGVATLVGSGKAVGVNEARGAVIAAGAAVGVGIAAVTVVGSGTAVAFEAGGLVSAVAFSKMGSLASADGPTVSANRLRLPTWAVTVDVSGSALVDMTSHVWDRSRKCWLKSR